MPIRLGNIAEGNDFFARETELADFWDYLEEQGYLICENQTIQFISFLLRDYWRRNHAI